MDINDNHYSFDISIWYTVCGMWHGHGHGYSMIYKKSYINADNNDDDNDDVNGDVNDVCNTIQIDGIPKGEDERKQ